MRLKYLTTIAIPSEDANRIQIMKMCEALSKKCDLTLVIGKKLSSWKQIKEYYGIKNDFRINEIGLDVTGIAVEGKRIKKLTLLKKIRPRYLNKLYSYIEKNDVVITREQFTAFFVSLCKYFKNFALVYETHNLPQNFLGKIMNKIIFSKSDKVISISKGLQEDIKKRYKKGSLVLFDCVDTNMFRPLKCDAERKKNKIPKKNVVMYVGNFYKWKGVDTLVSASKHIKNAEIYLIGGDEKNIGRVKILIEKEGHKIHVMKKQPYFKIPSLLACADILVLPNTRKEKIAEKYTSPLKVMEYASMKIPIVASDVLSLKSMLKENAVYFKADDEKDLAAKINSVLKNKQKYKKMVDGAYKLSREFSWDNRAKKLISYLK